MSLLLAALLAQVPPQHVTLVFGGDVIPHAPVKEVARLHTRLEHDDERGNNGGWDHVFGPLSTVLRQADLSVVNLETPVTSGKAPLQGEKVFNAPLALLLGLRAAGVQVATFANNHSLDQGRAGILETRRCLDEAGLLTAGADVTRARAWLPVFAERNGVRLGVMSFTRWLNGHGNSKDRDAPYVPVVPYAHDSIEGGLSPDVILEQVKAAAALVDVLVVTVHWGEEYKSEPLPEDRELARRLVEAGALVVIGHHPHVLQPVERVRRADGTMGVVAFSVGNLVSNQDLGDPDGPAREGMLLEVSWSRERPGALLSLTQLTPVPVWTENRASAGRLRNVQPVLLDDELVAIRERADALVTRRDLASRQELAALRVRAERAERHRAHILSMVPELPATAQAVPHAAAKP